MQRYIIGRVLLGIACFLVVSLIVFILVRLTGNPVHMLLPDDATQEDIARLTAQLGLDKPMVAQYWMYIGQLLRGNFGDSLRAGVPALQLVLERFPATIQLGLTAMVFSLLIGLVVGMYSAYKFGSGLDIGGRVFAILGQSVPTFWLGIVLILVFSVFLGILPAGGQGDLKNLILPAISLGWYNAAGIMRLTRSSMIDVLGAEYIKLARLKGVPEQVVLWKHGFKNAVIPVLTFSALIMVVMLNGAVVIETVFAWPGVGRLVIQAISWRDFPVIQTAVLILSAFYITANLVVDITYAFLNPKIRYKK